MQTYENRYIPAWMRITVFVRDQKDGYREEEKNRARKNNKDGKYKNRKHGNKNG